MNITILNREFKHPADGWYQIEAKGFHPCVGDCDGVRTKILQVIDDKAITCIVNRFNDSASRAKLPQGSEMVIDRDHLKDHRDANGAKDRETVAYGWAKELRVSPDGSGIDVKQPWTASGKTAVDGGDYRFFSTEYDGPENTHFEEVSSNEVPPNIRRQFSDYRFLRPLELTGLTLTNDLNNKGQKAITITNRNSEFRSTPAADNKQPTTGQKMKSVCTLLKLSADASEEAVHAAVIQLQNRVSTLEPLEAANTTLKNRNTELEGEQCDILMDAHGLKPDATQRATLRPVLISLKNRGERVSFLNECVTKPAAATVTTQTRLHNRDTKPPVKEKTAGEENTAADGVKAVKIMNRARQIKKDVSNVSLATAVTMAQKEITAEE